MAVFHKTTIDQARKDIESYYEEVHKLLDCQALDAEEAIYYTSNPEISKVVYVFIDDLTDAIGHLKVSLDSLKKLKSKQLKPNTTRRSYDPADD